MAKMRLIIDRKDEDVFEFEFLRDTPYVELAQDRVDVVRLMDEAIDALMRLPQKFEAEQLGGAFEVYRTKIQAGGLDEKS